MSRIHVIWPKFPKYCVYTPDQGGLTLMWHWGGFCNSPIKWLCPKASISSKRTRPPGAWRGVTLRPSMREHCWNPVAVTFHSKISEAVASCRILWTGIIERESPSEHLRTIHQIESKNEDDLYIHKGIKDAYINRCPHLLEMLSPTCLKYTTKWLIDSSPVTILMNNKRVHQVLLQTNPSILTQWKSLA
jgi:hypothetical protein